jgi:5-methylcytosine-specific restriction endonuclease McrA
MPWAPLRRCREPGCTRRQAASRCELHRSRQARGYDAAWERIRLEILVRDGYRCRIGGPGCTIRATTVDHIVPLALGGARLDPANLRAACGHCNTSLGGRVVRPITWSGR